MKEEYSDTLMEESFGFQQPMDESQEIQAFDHHNLEQEHRDPLTFESKPTLQAHIRELEHQHENILQQLIHKEQEMIDLQGALLESRVHIGALEAQMKDAKRRCEEAVSTLFRLRPQRQECPESEIKQDYELLKASIESWVEKNLEIFLDNDKLGYEIIGGENFENILTFRGYETILKNFRSQRYHYNDEKDQVLISVIMRLIYERILNQTYPACFAENHRTFLSTIEKNMRELEPKKDLSTIVNWRCDTIASLLNCRELLQRQDTVARNIARDIFDILRRAIFSWPHRISDAEIIKSLLSQVIEPSFALAQKIQCATSQWRFLYSRHWGQSPGQLAHRLPGFFDTINEFHYINVSAHRRTLKPSTDLATQKQADSLVYLLDVFPGLYCRRMDIDKMLPRMAVNQSVLLVDFQAPAAHKPKGHSELRPQREIEERPRAM